MELLLIMTMGGSEVKRESGWPCSCCFEIKDSKRDRQEGEAPFGSMKVCRQGLF